MYKTQIISHLFNGNADAKITDLTAYTTPLSSDVLPIVDVANSLTKKVSIATLQALPVPKTSLPNGLRNDNTAEQSQTVVSATDYYITNSNIALPNPMLTGLVVGSAITWRISLSKTNAGTGAFAISIWRGTNGSASDTQDVLQTIGTQTAAVDSMVVDVTLRVASTGASGSYFWTISPFNKAVTATGFGVATGTTGLFSGTVSSVAMNTAGLNFGIGFRATTGTPTIRVVSVQARAYNID